MLHHTPSYAPPYSSTILLHHTTPYTPPYSTIYSTILLNHTLPYTPPYNPTYSIICSTKLHHMLDHIPTPYSSTILCHKRQAKLIKFVYIRTFPVCPKSWGRSALTADKVLLLQLRRFSSYNWGRSAPTAGDIQLLQLGTFSS
ncbi:hypothetical protein Bpfe_011548 [Biomphalaria pfeifferi]|uniref:Uncharacterized protein n=1 Tax=Biomphalaria pfeifferi TaxID=112525 RepID=A0AAD8FCM3_BIOPF|nr:hypothetical protein Bpfe_011548 [Biomphalaria pfeifferi]